MHKLGNRSTAVAITMHGYKLPATGAVKQWMALCTQYVMSSPRVSSPGVQPAALQNAPVRPTEIGVAQSVTDWVHCTVDVA